MRDNLTIVKVGGNVVEEEASLKSLLKDFSRIAGNKILVHGGGKTATILSEKLGIEAKKVDGRRITDAETLKVVTMVYAGLVNKNIVAGLQALGNNAIGLTGADLDMITAIKRPVKEIDYGYVGDIKTVNFQALNELIEEGAIPVMAPITHDGHGQLLNTNADTIASEIAVAMSREYEVRLIFCFEKSGVLMNEADEHSKISEINPELFEQLKSDGIVSGGMIPKLSDGFAALHRGVKVVVITNPAGISEGLRGTRLVLE
ncbi:MAG: acetylglutamate kinase [Marinilabiliales bacterium]|nr:acetylglutamate kinase [Marinilabiliales bacterium]